MNPLSFRIEPEGSLAWVIMDTPEKKVNTWNRQTLEDLNRILDQIMSRRFEAVVFMSAKAQNFIAGADIDEIQSLKSEDEFAKALEMGQTLFNKVEDLPCVTIAAIHGSALGGGLEFALACDYRIATDDASTKLGLPEVRLGIIPGFGGCVRLPKVIGLVPALDLILSGKTIDARRAEKLGLVDFVVHPNLLKEYARMWAQKYRGQKRSRWPREQRPFYQRFLENCRLTRRMIFQKAGERTRQETKGHYPAPEVALEVLAQTYGLKDRESALKIEQKGFLKVVLKEVNRNLLFVWELTEKAKKVSVQGQPAPIRRVGVIGSGIMGAGIGFVAADRGFEVRFKEVNWTALSRAFQHARIQLDKQLNAKKINLYEYHEKLARLSGGVDWADFRRLDMVIEAVVEDMDVKKKLFQELSSVLPDNTIVATNTSSLSVTEMSQAYKHPQKVVGLHFFNPVEKMPLVEVIATPHTEPDVVATALEWARRLGKTAIVVKDAPGFLVNRLLLPYLAEAAFLLQEGYPVEPIDQIMVKVFGMPMGPFALMDEVGWDVCFKVLGVFQRAFGNRIEIPHWMNQAVQLKDRLGKKSGLGFYRFDSKGRRLGFDPSVYEAIKLQVTQNSWSEEKIIDRLVLPMVNEAARALLEDQVTNSAWVVDLAMIFGTGFPPFRGGLLHWADELGVSQCVNRLERLESQAFRLRPSQALREVARVGSFYKLFPGQF